MAEKPLEDLTPAEKHSILRQATRAKKMALSGGASCSILQEWEKGTGRLVRQTFNAEIVYDGQNEPTTSLRD